MRRAESNEGPYLDAVPARPPIPSNSETLRPRKGLAKLPPFFGYWFGAEVGDQDFEVFRGRSNFHYRGPDSWQDEGEDVGVIDRKRALILAHDYVRDCRVTEVRANLDLPALSEELPYVRRIRAHFDITLV